MVPYSEGISRLLPDTCKFLTSCKNLMSNIDVSENGTAEGSYTCIFTCTCCAKASSSACTNTTNTDDTDNTGEAAKTKNNNTIMEDSLFGNVSTAFSGAFREAVSMADGMHAIIVADGEVDESKKKKSREDEEADDEEKSKSSSIKVKGSPATLARMRRKYKKKEKQLEKLKQQLSKAKEEEIETRKTAKALVAKLREDGSCSSSDNSSFDDDSTSREISEAFNEAVFPGLILTVSRL